MYYGMNNFATNLEDVERVVDMRVYRWAEGYFLRLLRGKIFPALAESGNSVREGADYKAFFVRRSVERGGSYSTRNFLVAQDTKTLETITYSIDQGLLTVSGKPIALGLELESVPDRQLVEMLLGVSSSISMFEDYITLTVNGSEVLVDKVSGSLMAEG